jgi:hypothetical protein
MAAVGTPLFAQEKKGPLAELPGRPGPHVEKIRAMGDNEWLKLGAPASDPKWGKARGSWWGRKPSPPPRTSEAFSCSAKASTPTSSPIHFKGKSPGVFVYDPNTNSWADPIPFPVDGPKFQFAANTFFDRELNAYFCHAAGDSKDDGVMWAYRYKKCSRTSSRGDTPCVLWSSRCSSAC